MRTAKKRTSTSQKPKKAKIKQRQKEIKET